MGPTVTEAGRPGPTVWSRTSSLAGSTLAAVPSLLPVDVDADGEELPRDDASVTRTHGARPTAAPPSATVWQAAASLGTSIAGFPCASLPFAVATVGWPGLAALAGGALLTAALSCHLVGALVVDPATGTRHSTYAALTRAHLRRRPRLAATASVVVRCLQATACVGTCIAATIIAGQGLKQAAALAAGASPLPLAGWIGVAGAGLAGAAALPSLESSWGLSVAAMASFVVYTSVMVGVSAADGAAAPPRSYAPLAGDARPLPSDAGSVLYGLGVIVFAFGVGVSPEVAATLPPPVAPRFHAATAAAFAVITPLFSLIAAVGYWAYGNAVSTVLLFSNIRAPATADGARTPAALARRAALGITCAAVVVNSVGLFAVYSFPVYQTVAAATRRHKWARTRAARFGGRCAFVVFVTVAAAAAPFFGDVASAMGAVFLMQDWVAPPLFYALTPEARSPRPPAVKAAMIALACVMAAFGAVVFGSAVASIVHSAETYRLFADL